ncbi:MAG: tRNA (N(6)-L-threonylcarbamoyladenosine(37)-C(2))-methylthiotransferase MtaB [Ignavibacteria bacterium]
MKTVTLHTLGCKLNYSETSFIAKELSAVGVEVKPYGEKADLFVLNTCTVTENADRECRQIIRSVLRKNPETFIVVTGCYAQLQPEEISRIEGVDLVLGTNEKFKVVEYLKQFKTNSISCLGKIPGGKIIVSDVAGTQTINEAFTSDTDSRTRAFLKIQDGCDYNCSFCTIPLARGKSRSLPLKNVLDNAKKILDAGYKEIVLTGVNTGDYKFNNIEFFDLLYHLEKLGIPRIRISSIEPNLLTDEIIELVKSSRSFCRHFHIPLQSGDPEILKLMKRRYNLNLFRELIYKLNEQIKNVGIGVDVIVGFPGETQERFNNTVNFLNELKISYLHVFTYSERKNTVAINLDGRVDVAIRKKRNHILQRLSDKKRYEFYLSNLGRVYDVLFESEKNGYYYGFTSNYIKIRLKSQNLLTNSIKPVLLVQATGVQPVDGELV